MKEKYTYASLDYIGKHKIYCFKRSFSNINALKRKANIYEKGDFLPLKANNYVYASNVLIFDLKNSLIHIIEDSVYETTICIKSNFDIDIIGCFKKKKYLSIDVYGRVLKVFNILDLYKCINSYPSIEVYLEEKSWYAKKGLIEDEFQIDCLAVIDNIKEYRKNKILLTGYVLGNSSSVNSSFDISYQINEDILKPMLIDFEENFIDKNSLYFNANILLEKLDLLYELTISNNGKIIKYYSFGCFKLTHIDRLKKEIKQMIDCAEEEELNCIMDIIFSSIDDEKYIDFIIETVSLILDINV